MGFRARKSVNFGGFRINFSKSGVGYSYGCRGARVTHTAKGQFEKHCLCREQEYPGCLRQEKRK